MKMGTGDYICITMTGGAPWGFRLQGGKDEKQPLQIAKIRNKSKASSAGLCEGDEVVSINGNPCADLTYSEVITLMEGLADTLQMLIKRSSSGVSETLSLEKENGRHIETKNEEYKESTTLQIRTAVPKAPQELLITRVIEASAPKDVEQSCVGFSGTNQERELTHCHKIPLKVIEAPEAHLINMPAFTGWTGESPGPTVELKLSLSHDNLKGSNASAVTVLGTEDHKPLEIGPTLLKDGTSWVTPDPEIKKDSAAQWSSRSFQIASGNKEVKAFYGAETKEPSLTKVEVILDCSNQAKEGSGSPAEKGCVDSPLEGGQLEAPPSVVSFGISSEGTEQGDEDQHSEREHSRPHKHRARHARLRRSESLSEKQVKEAKSKCKSIALLLTAAPNPNSKGVLMFKKRRQRARKYTLVSYGTGELERYEDEGEEDEEEEGDKENTFEVTLLGTSESEIDEDFFSDLDKEDRIVTFDWDTGLLEVEKKPKSGDEMSQLLPDSKGKGALMFAKRRQRVDQVTAEQEAMKMQGMHRSSEEHQEITSMENTHKMSSSIYQSKQEASRVQQSHVSKSYIEVSRSHGTAIQQNGIGVAPETNMIYPSSATSNRMAKPFPGVQNRAAAPFSPTRSMTSPLSDLPAPPPYTSVSPPPEAMYRTVLTPVATSTTQSTLLSPVESTEQIASRDERIAVPAIRTGILQEAKRRNTAKPMFTFKEAPKMTPNPALLSLVQNTEGKKGVPVGFESGPEEDYLSLGAEACNFMQIQAAKQKIPPPVAPKPSLKVSPTATTPVSPVWSPPAVAVTQPSAFPAPHSPEVAVPAPVKTVQPIYPPPQPPTTLNLTSPLKGPQIAASHQNYTPRATPTTPLGNSVLAGGVGPAFEMPPALSGKGAQLFAKRQSRMEKYVVDSETVQANMARASSPTPSLPASWKYSSNVRAPPPVAYNPIQSPSYPLAATKQQSKSPGAAKTTKKKPKKALSSLEVMKHQPYQLNASLFTFQPPSDNKEGVPKQPTKFDSKQALPSRSLNAGSPSNVRASSVYSVPTYSSQPFSPSNASSPVIESCAPTVHSTFPKQESPASSMFTTPKPKFSAKKVGVTAQGRGSERSLSISGWPPSTTLRSMSPISPGMFQPAPDYFSKPMPTGADKPGKRLTPWEAAAKSPLGLVDDAFGPQTIQESIAANVVSAARRKTLPAPPDDWKQKVAYEHPAPSAHTKLSSIGRSHSATVYPPKSTMSAPSSTTHSSSRLQHAYYDQRTRTDPDVLSMSSRSDYCLSISDPNYNPHPKGWRRQT
ncbi:synaptopodin-2 [Anolis sagrei]|uniref:synaptopodin-2 n=1 Tax=Anolis sagrei TaxID=38937 RepID=UPI0035201B48